MNDIICKCGHPINEHATRNGGIRGDCYAVPGICQCDKTPQDVAAAQIARLREALGDLVSWVRECNFEGEFYVDEVLKPAARALEEVTE